MLDDNLSTFSGSQTSARPFEYLVADDLLQALEVCAHRRLTEAEMPPRLKVRSKVFYGGGRAQKLERYLWSCIPAVHVHPQQSNTRSTVAPLVIRPSAGQHGRGSIQRSHHNLF